MRATRHTHTPSSAVQRGDAGSYVLIHVRRTRSNGNTSHKVWHSVCNNNGRLIARRADLELQTQQMHRWNPQQLRAVLLSDKWAKTHTITYTHTSQSHKPAWRNFKLIKHTQMHLTHPDSHNIKDRHAHFLYGHMNAFHHQSNLCLSLSLSLWWSDDERCSAYKATHSFLFITRSDNISP